MEFDSEGNFAKPEKLPVRKKRDRSKSTEALNNDQQEKKSKPNTAGKLLDNSEVGVRKSVGAQMIVNSSESIEFGAPYQIEGNNAQYKFIRKSGSDDDIIYLAGEQDGRLYEYDTQAEEIKPHPLSKFHKMTTDLSPDYVTFAKNLLLRNPTSEDQKIDNVSEEGLNTISKSLNTCVNKLVTELRQEDDMEIGLDADSKYGRILQRSIQAIRDKYGLEIDYVAAVQEGTDKGTQARDGLNGVKLHHSTQRWEDNKNNDNSATAKLAATYLMSNDKGVRATTERIRKKHHNGYSISATREAYASKICKDNKQLTKSLAEARLRYSPITYGSDIYLAINTVDPSETEEWGHFNTLIHEALHGAEHPDFTAFLETYIPASLQEDIREGIVDYLTNQVWIEVLKNLSKEKGSDGNRTSPSHQDFDKPLQMNNEAKNIYKNGYFAYEGQVKTVKTLIRNLEGGEKRLISAYFGGNLGAFLPKLNDTEEEKI